MEIKCKVESMQVVENCYLGFHIMGVFYIWWEIAKLDDYGYVACIVVYDRVRYSRRY